MAQSKRGRNLKDWKSNRSDAGDGKLRIIGGEYRGRLVEYSGDPVTRPMKDNIREALFNLVGGWVEGKVVFDLFAGTGAIGLEAISRGASEAIFVERHFPTVKLIEQNIQTLGPQVKNNSSVHASDTFFWVRQFVKNQTHPTDPWLVFCCPPYDFFLDREEELLAMLSSLIPLAPAESLFVVESDERFETDRLPKQQENPSVSQWAVRQYAPAQVAVLKIEAAEFTA
ncbi:MAG: RsmD family RNA methyltransferase [Planctomycetota bacterium]